MAGTSGTAGTTGIGAIGSEDVVLSSSFTSVFPEDFSSTMNQSNSTSFGTEDATLTQNPLPSSISVTASGSFIAILE